MHCCDVILYVRLTNEWYAKDTSKKIRTVMKSKGEAGEHLCTNPPYGCIREKMMTCKTEKRHSPQATPFPENISNTVL